MEITRTPPVPGIAAQTREPTAAAPQARDQAAAAQARGQAVKAQSDQVEARQQVSDALARAILADSDVEPVDITQFNVRLDIHKETGRVVAEIENKKTGELLQKIPSETILRGAVMLDRVLGTILDTPA